MKPEQSHPAPAIEVKHWKALVEECQQPSIWRASWQLINTLVPYAALWVIMYWSLGVSWLLTIPIALFASLFLVRIFIIFHDCGHGSFFASRRANAFWGFVTGLLTMTPYYQWRGEHAIHHGSTGDLGRRGIGDVWTMTVQEYIESTRWKRFAYRMARNPVVLLGIAPVVLFVILQRFPRPGATPSERRSVWSMNIAIALMATAMSAIFGILPYLTLQLLMTAFSGALGVWLFYLQHQFEEAYWERGADWDYTAAALQGSSFLRLPRVLQWFSGNIGFHHIHHLSPRIPNYHLARCHRSHPLFTAVRPMTLTDGIKALGLKLWDESSKRLVSFRHLRKRRRNES